jgi:hypothetical protein
VGTVSLQNVIMGPRPNDIPTGSSTTRTGTNSTTPAKICSAGSQILQQLNCVRKDNRPLTSRFKGVSKKVKNGPEWCARGVDNIHVGYFHTEREAAIAAATSYVRAYGTWAETSDLFTEDQSDGGTAVTGRNARDLLASTDTSAAPVPKITWDQESLLKDGDTLHGVSGKFMGTFRDFESAVAHRKAHVAMVQEHEWQAHLLLTPTKDSDGDVAIAQ